MTRYLARRVLQAVPTVIGLTLLIFVLIRVIPGDPVGMMFPPDSPPSPQQVAEIRHQLGLDQPVWVQYVLYISRGLHGDLGRSYQLQTPVLALILSTAPATVELMLGAMLVSILIGIPAGIVSAIKQYSFFDYGTIGVTSVGVAAPVFWVGLILILVFAVDLRWLPASDRMSVRSAFTPITQFYVLDSILQGNPAYLRETLAHLALPSLTLGLSNGALIARITRASMLEVMPKDYIMTARAKGLRERAVVLSHALRNALIPVITVIGLQMGYLLGGAVLTETVFNWPGLGALLVTRIEARDYPVVQGVVLFVGLSFIVVNLLADVLYAIANPRVRYE